MGRFNACKREASREKHQKQNDKNAKGGSHLDGIKNSLKGPICAVCKQPFIVSVKAPALKEHAETKHSKTLADCFPEFEKPEEETQ